MSNEQTPSIASRCYGLRACALGGCGGGVCLLSYGPLGVEARDQRQAPDRATTQMLVLAPRLRKSREGDSPRRSYPLTGTHTPLGREISGHAEPLQKWTLDEPIQHPSGLAPVDNARAGCVAPPRMAAVERRGIFCCCFLHADIGSRPGWYSSLRITNSVTFSFVA